MFVSMNFNKISICVNSFTHVKSKHYLDFVKASGTERTMVEFSACEDLLKVSM